MATMRSDYGEALAGIYEILKRHEQVLFDLRV